MSVTRDILLTPASSQMAEARFIAAAAAHSGAYLNARRCSSLGTRQLNTSDCRRTVTRHTRIPCAVARKPRDAAATFFGLKFADKIHYKFKGSQASKAMLQNSKHSGAKQNLMQNGHSRSHVLESVERR